MAKKKHPSLEPPNLVVASLGFIQFLLPALGSSNFCCQPWVHPIFFPPKKSLTFSQIGGVASQSSATASPASVEWRRPRGDKLSVFHKALQRDNGG